MVLNLKVEAKPPASERRTIRYARQKARRSTDNRGCETTAIDGDLHNATRIAERASRWAAPWTVRRYPGRERLLRAIMGRSVTVQMINAWRSGERPLPVWAALALADAIERRATVGLQIALELVRYAEHKTAADAAKPSRGAWWKRLRGAGVAPSGLGARGKMPGSGGADAIADGAELNPADGAG